MQSTTALILITVIGYTTVVANESQVERHQEAFSSLHSQTEANPVLHVAKGLNEDGTLVKYYRRGLDYAINYFGNYGPYHVYLLGPGDKKSILNIYRERAKSRINPNSTILPNQQIKEYLRRPNVINEIQAVLEGKAEGGLTWSKPPRRVYEDVTTNSIGRQNDPVENTWGALHEYHHVFQIAHCDSYADRDSDRNLSSWMSEGMATYSSSVFMERLGLIDFKKYMLDLRDNGSNIGRPGINEFIAGKDDWRLDDESYWESGEAPQVYYMLGAWATAYLIHENGIEETTVLKDWYFDVPRIGKAAAFKKHMKIPLDEFLVMFDNYIRQPNEMVMKIFQKPNNEKNE